MVSWCLAIKSPLMGLGVLICLDVMFVLSNQHLLFDIYEVQTTLSFKTNNWTVGLYTSASRNSIPSWNFQLRAEILTQNFSSQKIGWKFQLVFWSWNFKLKILTWNFSSGIQPEILSWNSELKFWVKIFCWNFLLGNSLRNTGETWGCVQSANGALGEKGLAFGCTHCRDLI